MFFKRCIQQNAERSVLNYCAARYFNVMHSYFYLQKHFAEEIQLFSDLFVSNIAVFVDSIVTMNCVLL